MDKILSAFIQSRGTRAFANAEGLTNNKLHRLTVNPDQGQRLEIYYRDGRLEQVTNSATFPVRYVHTVEQDGTNGPWREVTTEIRYRGDANTNEWVKTYTDGAGRAYKTVYAAASGTPYRLDTYNNLGQLIQQRDPDGVLTLYQYNSQGQLEYTVLDLDQDGVIDWSGTDRKAKGHALLLTWWLTCSWRGVGSRACEAHG